MSSLENKVVVITGKEFRTNSISYYLQIITLFAINKEGQVGLVQKQPNYFPKDMPALCLRTWMRHVLKRQSIFVKIAEQKR